MLDEIIPSGLISCSWGIKTPDAGLNHLAVGSRSGHSFMSVRSQMTGDSKEDGSD
ncbi:hypothetical protein WJM97_14335 [Okeanomitos corallinicola TIOX110]|uniref:Uncharacterized protein n=1 Tax=Okeanomitos corallinicola TIOX110 TaxID=3133117 RepID=A0ABZ2UQZ2_9CYAN